MRVARPLGRLPVGLGRVACRRGRRARQHPRACAPPRRCGRPRRARPRRDRRAAAARARRPTRGAARAARSRPAGGRGRRAPPRARRRRRRARPRPAGAPRAARSASPARCAARSRRRRGAPRRRRGARSTAARSSCAIRARNAAISTASFSARSAAVAWSASGRSRLRTSSSTSFARSTWVPTRASLSSARCLRRLNLPSPAASSTRWRRSSGFEASTASTLPCETIECIEPPRPTSASSSTRSVRRTAALLTRYWPSPPRTSRRVIAISLKSTSSPKPPSSLSKTSSTSQWSAGCAVRGAAEEDVVGLLGAELGRGQRAGGPDDRVGDVRLAGAVRADDHGHARLELELDRVDERLEAADLDRLEVHVRRTLTRGAADVASADEPGDG